MTFKLAFLNLFRNKRRSLSTGLAICIGFVGMNLLGAYIFRVKKALDATSVYSALHGHIQLYKKDALVQFSLKPKDFALSKAEVDAIQGILNKYNSEIEYVGHNLSGAGLLSNGVKSHPVFAYSFEPEIYAKSLSQPELLEWAYDWILPSQLKNIETFRNNSEVISITPKIAEIMNFKMPLADNGSAQFAARSFEGDLNAINVDLGAEHTTGLMYLEDMLIIVPLKKMQELFATDGIESMSIYLQKNTDLKPMKEKLEAEFKALPFRVDAFFYYDEKINSIYSGTLGFLIVMGGFFVFLIGTAVSLTIINSLTMGIIERTKEIGTLRAVGFSQNDVARVFVVESLILCGLSIVVGVVLTSAIAAIVNQLNIRFTPPAASGKIQFLLVWNLSIALLVSTIILIITWVSSFLVMRKKSKIKLIDLLNDTGA